MNQNPTPQSVQAQYQAGLSFNKNIELYDCVETNENFFVGRQWEGVDAGGLPTPVFNFLKRVVLFCVANVSTDNLRLNASPMAAAPMSATDISITGGMKVLTSVLNEQFTEIFERNSLGGLIREFCRNAAVDGDGCIYSYWDPTIETGQREKGGVVSEIVQNTAVIFGNPNNRSVQKQPYIIIERRMLVPQAQKYAKEMGASQETIEAIVADSKEGANQTMDANGGNNKVTVLLKLWRDDETGTIHGYECTSAAEIREPWDLGIKLYPIVWMNWDYVQDCYHGQAMITGLIPNQIFVNKLFAMSMISLMTLAYPKVVYDRTKIAQWTNRVGASIGVGGPVNDVAKIMAGAAISPQISEFIDLAVSYTQKFLGASDIALGDTRPDNAAAIIALQRAAATPMELTKQNLFQCVEDLGRIYMEFMGSYYHERTVMSRSEEPGVGLIPIPFDFDRMKDYPCSVKLDVGASSYWSEIASMQTLDNLLMQGKISTIEYLKRVPAGMIPDKEALISVMEAAEMAPPTLEEEPVPESAIPEEPPELVGGSGDHGFQRALRETGQLPKEVQ